MDHDAINERCARELLAWLDQKALTVKQAIKGQPDGSVVIPPGASVSTVLTAAPSHAVSVRDQC